MCCVALSLLVLLRGGWKAVDVINRFLAEGFDLAGWQQRHENAGAISRPLHFLKDEERKAQLKKKGPRTEQK